MGTWDDALADFNSLGPAITGADIQGVLHGRVGNIDIDLVGSRFDTKMILTESSGTKYNSKIISYLKHPTDATKEASN